MSDLPNPTMPLSPVTLPRGSLHRPRSTEGVGHGAAPHGGVEVAWARHLDEVRQAQRLRFDVFASEMGARLQTALPGHGSAAVGRSRRGFRQVDVDVDLVRNRRRFRRTAV